MLSTLAPASTIMKLPFFPGITGANAGLLIPFILPTMKVHPAKNAPVLPAELTASQIPSLTKFKALQRLESFFLLTAITGCSLVVITSLASITIILLPL